MKKYFITLIIILYSIIVSCKNPQNQELIPPTNVIAALVGENFHIAWNKSGSGLSYDIL